MTIRSRERTVTFNRPFTLETSGEILPPGSYVVETVEETIKDVSFLAYRRVLTLLHIPSRTPNTAMARSLKIDPDRLDTALARDAKPDESPALRQPSDARRQAADARTADRAGNVGMLAPSSPAMPHQRELQQQRSRRHATAAAPK